MTLPLPRAQSTYVDATGRPTTEFYKWLQSVERDSGGTDPALALAIRQIAEKLGSPDGSVAGIPNVYPGLSADTEIIGIGGQIQVSGSLASGEALVGLASVTDSGAGELLAITRDTFGRVSGSRATLPSDIPNPSWRFLIDPDGNYLSDPDGDLLRAPGYEFDETVFLSSANPQMSGGDEHAPINANSVTSFGRNSNIVAEMISASATSAFAPRFNWYRARGTMAAPADVVDGDTFGGLQCLGYAAGAYTLTGRMLFTASGATGAVSPGRIELSVSSNSLGAGSYSAGIIYIDSSPSLFPNVTNATALGKAANNWNGVYSNAFYSGASQVVGARRTGWAAATGTATRTTFATGTVTLPQLAERVKALLDDLIAHGLIGT